MRKVRVWDNVRNEMLYGRVEQFDDMLGFRFEKHLETENPWEEDKNHSGFEPVWNEFVENWSKFQKDWEGYIGQGRAKEEGDEFK